MNQVSEEEQNNLGDCEKCSNGNSGDETSPPSQSPNFSSDDWEPIAAQIDYWRDMDLQYWEQRREREYSAWLDRRIKSRIKRK